MNCIVHSLNQMMDTKKIRHTSNMYMKNLAEVSISQSVGDDMVTATSKIRVDFANVSGLILKVTFISFSKPRQQRIDSLFLSLWSVSLPINRN